MMAMSARVLFLFSATISVSLCLGAVDLGYLTEDDLNSLKSVFNNALTSKDLANIHFGAAGLKELDSNAAIPNIQALCEAAGKADMNDLEQVYHATGLAEALGTACKFTNAQAVQTANKAISTTAGSNSQSLYYATKSLESSAQKVDKLALKASLEAAVKKDDSALSLGYSYHVALSLDGDVTSYFNRIEDTIAQGDELDNKYIQFDGGLSVTAIAVKGLYLLAEKVNKVPVVKADEAVKLANYLLSRKGARLPRQAYLLLATLKILTKNKYHIPVSVSLWSNMAVSASEPKVQARVCNVLGETVGGVTVTIDTATHVPTSGVVLSKKHMTKAPHDKTNTLYDVNLMETKRDRGFYKLAISIASQDKRLVGTNNQNIHVKVMSEVSIGNVELSVSDREQANTANVLKPIHPKKLQNVVDADFHQKLIMKFSVLDSVTKQAFRVHQAFVMFTNQASGQEIIFVAESDKNNNYKFDVDVHKAGKDFGHLSGKYSMNVVVGDSIVNNPILWTVADVNFKFEGSPVVVKDKLEAYTKRKEIKHMFREPEKRPPQVVSDAFTGLVLLPILVLLGLWMKIGVNLSKFSLDLWTLGFHVGFAAIMGLYGLFWWQLNMFTTLKYLFPLALLTFLAGNRMLKGHYNTRTGTKSE